MRLHFLEIFLIQLLITTRKSIGSIGIHIYQLIKDSIMIVER